LKNKHAQEIKFKRVYEKPEGEDGYRILIDRLWPRGLKKENAAVDDWAKEIAPSNELRKWFNHDADRWKEFGKRYKAELREKKTLESFRNRYNDKKRVTLLYATKFNDLTHAIILKELMENGHQ